MERKERRVSREFPTPNPRSRVPAGVVTRGDTHTRWWIINAWRGIYPMVLLARGSWPIVLKTGFQGTGLVCLNPTGEKETRGWAQALW